MPKTIRNRTNVSAFTLVEIMIVVAIIGLLAALAIPAFAKARKQSQGRRIVNDVKKIDEAIDQMALERGMKDGEMIWLHNDCPGDQCACIWSYIKKKGMGASGDLYGGTAADVLGNPYVFGAVGSNQVRVADETKLALVGVGIDWGPY